MIPSDGNITQLLKALSGNDQTARDKLFALIYRDLRKRAGALMRWERPNHTLQPTALINEAYIRLVGDAEVDWRDREHFFKFATKVMRHILIDSARKHGADKRGGPLQRVLLDDVELSAKQKDIDLLALDEALTEFEQLDPTRSAVVELRYFGEFSIEEIAELTKLSPATVKRYLKTCLAWMRNRIEGS